MAQLKILKYFRTNFIGKVDEVYILEIDSNYYVYGDQMLSNSEINLVDNRYYLTMVQSSTAANA